MTMPMVLGIARSIFDRFERFISLNPVERPSVKQEASARLFRYEGDQEGFAVFAAPGDYSRRQQASYGVNNA